jgi:hypothetical protein
MPDFARILEVKKAAQGRLMALPGVHAVGVGAKYSGGRRTGEPSIVVLVVKKKPLSDLRPEDVVPPEIDGVKTDVVEADVPQILQDLDESAYKDMEGGILIAPRGGIGLNGTIACIGHTKDPAPKVVAVTCQHVVAMPSSGGKASLLQGGISASMKTVIFSGSNTPGSLVDLYLEVMPAGPGPAQYLNAFYITKQTDGLPDIASAVAAAVNALGNPGVTATWNPGDSKFTVNWGNGFIALAKKINIYGVRGFDKSAKLKANVSGNTITLTGGTAKDHGIYTNMNAGGQKPSFGVFISVDRTDNLDDVAQHIADAVNQANFNGVTAASAGAVVTIAGVSEVECDITSDVRFGQPDDTYCCRCCWCCGQQLGRVIGARLDVDAAIIELKAGLTYKADVEGIGAIKGIYDLQDSDTVIPDSYKVQKRGSMTLVTQGSVRTLHLDGQIGFSDQSSNPPANIFHRYYTEALWIDYPQGHPFAQPGDSGAAILNSSQEIVGVVFGGPADPNSTAPALGTPISQITTALNITLATAQTAGIVQTVSAQEGVAAMAIGPQQRDGRLRRLPAANVGSPQWHRLHQVEQEIAQTPLGREYSALVRSHMSEVVDLINTNKRVAAVWQRNSGPDIVESLLRLAHSAEYRIPLVIGGVELEERLTSIQRVLTRFGSSGLSSDLQRCAPFFASLGGQTYPEILAKLDSPPGRSGAGWSDVQ